MSTFEDTPSYGNEWEDPGPQPESYILQTPTHSYSGCFPMVEVPLYAIHPLRAVRVFESALWSQTLTPKIYQTLTSKTSVIPDPDLKILCSEPRLEN